MKQRHALLATPAVVVLLSGCIGAYVAEHVAQQTETSNAQLAQSCAGSIDLLLTTYCNAQAETSLTRSQFNPVKQQAAGMRMQCGRQASVAPKLAELDACAARLDASVGAENAAQAERLPLVRAKATEVRADPEYLKLLESWKSAKHAVTVTGDNWEIAKRESNRSVFEYQSRHKDAVKHKDAVAAAMRAFFARHGIDPRDAAAVGLW
jgi:hypothetical protein